MACGTLAVIHPGKESGLKCASVKLELKYS